MASRSHKSSSKSSSKKPAKKAAAKPAKKAATPAAKPAPATKVTAKPATGGDLLRGVALVEAALAKRGDLTPADPAILASTTLGERPLTPSLQRWLESDADFFTLGTPQSLSVFIYI